MSLPNRFSQRSCGHIVFGTLLGAALVAGLPAPGRAQEAQTVADATTRQPTPAEYGWGLDLYVDDVLAPMADYRTLIRPDFVGPAVGEQTRKWIESLQTAPVKGLELDPMGKLYVAVGKDSIAKRQFAERLGTKGLSASNKAYTLVVATRAFAHPDDAARIQTAVRYMAELDALPVDAMWKFLGRMALGQAYYVTGHGPEVVTQLSKAIALVTEIPFEERQDVFMNNPLPMLADVLSGMPGGRARIDSIGASMLPLAAASPEQIARDSGYFWTSRFYTYMAKSAVQLTAHLGQPAPAITANHWYNVSAPVTESKEAPGARTQTLADGKIRLLEYGEYNCHPCRMALPGMERIHKAYPTNVEVWYVTQTDGFWGTTEYSPDEEAQHLAHYYVDRKHYDFAIALWAGEKVKTQENGALPRDNPSATAFPIDATPTFVVVDGKGIVRHISIGYDAEVEKLLTSDVQYLVAEAKRQASAAPTSASPSISDVSSGR
jgi:thiol-disulfide isomerase/thioredoxin